MRDQVATSAKNGRQLYNIQLDFLAPLARSVCFPLFLSLWTVLTSYSLFWTFATC